MTNNDNTQVSESQETIINRFDETINVLTKSKKNLINVIELAVYMITDCFKNGNKIMICGNGGSAADAQHIAAEFTGKFYKIDRPALPAMAFHTNSSSITAIANDFGYNLVFKRQMEAFAQEGDILVCISTSGDSENIIEAIKVAKERNVKVISLTGKTGGEMGKVSDLTIRIPSTNTPIIQNAHIATFHTICELVEKQF